MADKTITGDGPIWTKRSTSAGLFHPMTGAMPTAGTTSIRTSISLSESTGDVKIQAAYQLTNDPSSWQAAVVITAGQSLTSDGRDWGVTYVSVADAFDDYQLVRYGLIATNNQNTTQDLGNGGIRFDLRA